MFGAVFVLIALPLLVIGTAVLVFYLSGRKKRGKE